MSKADRIDAQIAALKEEQKLAKIEDKFRAKKAEGTLTNKDKQDLRAARQAFREEHRQPKTGAAVDAIGATAQVEEV